MLRRAVCLGMVRRAQAPLRDDKLSKETMSSLRGVPMNNLKRKVQIFNYFPASTQNEMHSVESDMWVLKFAEQPRWSHNLMGWTSTRDPNHGLKMKFPSKEAAIKFAEEQGYTYDLDEVCHRKKGIPEKAYADNFKYKPPHDMADELF